VRNEFVAPTGLSFGQDEAQLAAVLISYGLLLAPPILVFAIVYTAVALGQAHLTPEQAEAMASDPVAVNRMMENAIATPPGALVCIAGLAAFAVLSARLYMVSAATIGEKRVVFFQTWSWSKGNVLRIIAAMLMTALPSVIINVLSGEILGSLAPAASGPLVRGAIGVIVGLIAAFASVPPTALGAELYRGLRPPGFVPK
jgi:hypothetical protein